MHKYDTTAVTQGGIRDDVAGVSTDSDASRSEPQSYFKFTVARALKPKTIGKELVSVGPQKLESDRELSVVLQVQDGRSTSSSGGTCPHLSLRSEHVAAASDQLSQGQSQWPPPPN